jgi:hypothetical protein
MISRKCAGMGWGMVLLAGGAVMLLQSGCATEKEPVATQTVTHNYNGQTFVVNEPVKNTSGGAEPVRADGGDLLWAAPGDSVNYAKVKNGGAVPFTGAPPDAQWADGMMDQNEEKTGFSK